LYVDDRHIVVKTEQLAVKQLKMALLVLQLAGWNIQWAKTDLKATQRQLHLGYITDTVQMKYYYPEEKKVLFDQQLACMLTRSKAGESIVAKEWASVLGRLQSMQRSHGKIVQVMSRACQQVLGVAVSAGGWEVQVQPQQDCMREMTFWLRYLKQHEGQQIQKPGKQVQVRKLAENQEEKLSVQQTEKVLEQYSKEEKVYVFTQEGRIEQRQEAGFKEDRGLIKDVIRELRTM
jgi:hypothetical protein